ncbi:rRNA maturation RNase YbeY [Candidatus Nomurabacteria bacterium RIFCSPHIGHO2_02_FULL_33_12]|uniref:Endoribonuclease YbeY n=1 Tax=Candidatus Nomurabacteria bacterium RIFCSPLOWO2_01_FULL_33_17 TaxID=1801764 RepID=A0A1F6WQC0_9BACT|nr:MAG: rRNA maturation RNase YbeY [Candidatus Nomurabacteria bacterium RIFCSPHIGHO2_02_FULL_33_12]OGI83945.1 MAG: rRNA maturation RNase YbeY [Candidatus Nomurabacteria bacterium RIFCSPLOWO2_01_FULL_33_17]
MIDTDTFSIVFLSSKSNINKREISSLPFINIKDHILGKNYELSLVIANKKTITNLNKKYRNMDYTPNILSFPYTKKSGEIFIHLPTAKLQAPKFDMDFPTYVVFLFIHGCLHLNDVQHSSTMEMQEMKILKNLYLNKKLAKDKNVRKK